jgi:DNA polymerase-3 subunit chi
MIKVTFYKIKDNAAKLRWICRKTEEAYEWEKRLLIYVPSQEAGHYIDTLLWKYSEQSFLPHQFTDRPTLDWIAITQTNHNINQASWLMNLSNQPLPLPDSFEEVFELYDETHPDKRAASLAKIESYKLKGIKVELVETISK